MASGPVSDSHPREHDDRELADDALPPVEPPTAGFLLQLFFIPLLIVGIIVLVFFSFSWLSQSETDLEKVVEQLEKGGTGTWSKALVLADLMREPRYESKKSDPKLAQRLGGVLKASIDGNLQDEESLKLRFYLARACGEFRVIDPLPSLIVAATTERSPGEKEVRVAALEGLAVLTGNNPIDQVLANPDLLPAIDKALHEKAEVGNPDDVNAKLRERAVFLLGVIGQEKQIEQLAQFVQDPFPNVRYNAALGLARQGDLRALPVLLDMLDPDNAEVIKGEVKEAQKQWKRESVAFNALKAVSKLVEKQPQADYSAAEKVLTRLRESEVGGQLRAAAGDVLFGLPKPMAK